MMVNLLTDSLRTMTCHLKNEHTTILTNQYRDQIDLALETIHNVGVHARKEIQDNIGLDHAMTLSRLHGKRIATAHGQEMIHSRLYGVPKIDHVPMTMIFRNDISGIVLLQETNQRL